MIKQIEILVSRLQQSKPLILCLTNYVTVEFVANALLAVGAAPIMSSSEEETTELIEQAAALYLNIGTMDHLFMERAVKTAQIARHCHKPVILDPVGCAATRLRQKAAQTLLPFSQCVRGNSDEILAMANLSTRACGVDSNIATKSAENAADNLHLACHATIMVSGAIDYISGETTSRHIPFGSPLMQKITGMGCCLTAIIAAFRAVHDDNFQATQLAGLFFALVGQMAATTAHTPAAFKQTFLDQLYQPDFGLMHKIYQASGEYNAS